MEEKLYYLAFSLAPGIGPKRFESLLLHFGTAQDAWKGNEKEFSQVGVGKATFAQFNAFRNSFDFKSHQDKLSNKNVQFISRIDSAYPLVLKAIDNPPIGLFVKGDIASIEFAKTIGVVGTRKMTGYGSEVTEQLVSDLVSYGLVIVSGLALGIDAIAHKTAVDSGGKTIAVLGCGVDCCYPRENEHIYRHILESGGAVVSEYPLSQKPSRGTFPARNRIIAGLSNGVLVTEAGADSGALITAEYARAQSKPVFAVPGPITSQQSVGTAQLIKQGALLIQNANDILTHFGINQRLSKKAHISFDSLPLSSEEKNILHALSQEELHVDDLSKKTHIDMSLLNQLLSSLELQGLVRNVGQGVVGISLNGNQSIGV